jgi:organic radical activating enzyme
LTLTREIIDRAATFPARAVVVTGGEPVLYNLNYLSSELKSRGIATFLETAGVKPLTGVWDWICLSPKKGSLPLAEYFNIASELKVIICSKDDFRWAELNAERCHGGCKLFLQPEWSVSGKITPLLVDYIKANPKWRISLQSHKYMNIP